MRITLLVALCMAVISGRALGATEPIEHPGSKNIKLVDYFGGPVTDYEIRGRYAYVAQGYQLRVLDLADLDHPSTVDRIVFWEEINSVALAGNALYLGMQGGPNIYDISNPAHPKLHSSFEYRARGMHTDTIGSSLRILSTYYDIEQEFLSTKHPLRPNSGAAVYKYSHFATNGEALYEIKDAEDEIYRVYRQSITGDDTLETTVSTGLKSPAFRLRNGQLVLASTNSTTIGLFRLDQPQTILFRRFASNDDADTREARIETNGQRALILADDLRVYSVADLACPVLTMKEATGKMFGRALYALDRGALKIFDLGSDGTIRGRGEFPGTRNAVGFRAEGHIAAVEVAHEGLIFFDITDPFQPVRKGSMQAPFKNVSGLVLQGKIAYAADDAGLVTLDISAPGKPRFSGRLDLPDPCSGVDVQGHTVALISRDGRALFIADVSNPKSPALKSRAGNLTDPWGIALTGQLALVADLEGGLKIYNTNLPGTTTLLSTYNTKWCSGVIAFGAQAYVGADGLRVIDISNPEKPALIKRLEGRYNELARRDHYLFSEGKIVDVSTPASPELVSRFSRFRFGEQGSECGKVFVADKYLFSTGHYSTTYGGENGFNVYSIENPANPRLIDSRETRLEYPLGFVAKDGFVYAAMGAGGILIMKIEP